MPYSFWRHQPWCPGALAPSAPLATPLMLSSFNCHFSFKMFASLICICNSVQIMLDARGQRGSWMLWPRKYFLFDPQNFLQPFLVIHQNFSSSSPKISDDLCHISQKFAL